MQTDKQYIGGNEISQGMEEVIRGEKKLKGSWWSGGLEREGDNEKKIKKQVMEDEVQP